MPSAAPPAKPSSMIPQRPASYKAQPAGMPSLIAEAAATRAAEAAIESSEPSPLMMQRFDRKYSRSSVTGKQRHEEFKSQPAGRSLVEGAQMQMQSQPTKDPGAYIGNKFMMDHMNALEEQLRAIAMRQNYMSEEERGYRGKLESSFKMVNEQTSLLVNDLINRVAVLDDALKKETSTSSLLLDKASIRVYIFR